MSTLLELPDEIDLRDASDKRQYTTDAKGRHLYGVFERTRTRSWTDITGFVLHQTACYMGERPARYLSTGAHGIVTLGGQRIRLHELTDRIVSANGFNARCASLEIDGRHAGDDSTPARAKATTWDDPTTPVREMPMVLTPEAIAAGRETFRSWFYEVEKNGGRVKFLFPHRCSSGTRRYDPGAAPWREIAMPIIEEFELNKPTPSFDPLTFFIDDGAAIPREWDPRAKGRL